eukprot:4091234-Prymnesium_polylepis.4
MRKRKTHLGSARPACLLLKGLRQLLEDLCFIDPFLCCPHVVQKVLDSLPKTSRQLARAHECFEHLVAHAQRKEAHIDRNWSDRMGFKFTRAKPPLDGDDRSRSSRKRAATSTCWR